MEAGNLHLEETVADTDIAFLGEQIIAFNNAQTGYTDYRPLGCRVLDSDGNIAAGLSGHTWGGCCEIRLLWVREDLRGQGIGAELLRKAEEEATARGCDLIVLDTHSFQAPGFYEKMGYETAGVIEGYPRGYRKHFFSKRLR